MKLKPLKMSKIPINTKTFHYSNSPLNNGNKNSLIFKKNSSPKHMINAKNIKMASFQKSKSINSKYSEVTRNKMFNTPVNNSISKSNNSNDFPNIKANKSNHNQNNYSRIKANKINLCLTKINYNIEDNNSNNNNSYTYNAFSRNNNENLLIEKKMDKKLSCTKSFNHLNRNLNNENIKSLFISSVKNNIKKLNSNSINSEKNTSKKKITYILKQK